MYIYNVPLPIYNVYSKYPSPKLGALIIKLQTSIKDVFL